MAPGSYKDGRLMSKTKTVQKIKRKLMEIGVLQIVRQPQSYTLTTGSYEVFFVFSVSIGSIDIKNANLPPPSIEQFFMTS